MMLFTENNAPAKQDGSPSPGAGPPMVGFAGNANPAACRRAPEPGPAMTVFTLLAPVVSCEQAAAAKGIPLANELKSLLLATRKGFVVLHLPGDGGACLRRVKRALDIRQACMASPAELASFGLRPGTVCALKDPVWSLPHLVSRRVLQRELVSTNDGTLQGFYRFQPTVLLTANSVVVGDFERGS